MNDTVNTYLSNISSVNLRQIWVFPIPSIPQRRQEHLTTILLVGQWKIILSLSSTPLHPVKSGLEFSLWGPEILSPVLAGKILVWQINMFAKSFIWPRRMTYNMSTIHKYIPGIHKGSDMRVHKISTIDKYVPSIHKGANMRMLNLLIISKSQKAWLETTDRGIEFWLCVFHILQCGIRWGQCLAVFIYTCHRSNIISHQPKQRLQVYHDNWPSDEQQWLVHYAQDDGLSWTHSNASCLSNWSTCSRRASRNELRVPSLLIISKKLEKHNCRQLTEGLCSLT